MPDADYLTETTSTITLEVARLVLRGSGLIFSLLGKHARFILSTVLSGRMYARRCSELPLQQPRDCARLMTRPIIVLLRRGQRQCRVPWDEKKSTVIPSHATVLSIEKFKHARILSDERERNIVLLLSLKMLLRFRNIITALQ